MSTERVTDQEGRELINGGPLYRQLRMPTRTLYLPCGYIGRDGQVYPTITLRPTCGVEEDYFTDEAITTSSKAVVTKVLENCIVELGGHELPHISKREPAHNELAEKLVQGMELADRTFALVQLRRMSMLEGNLLRKKYACRGRCKKEFTAVLDLAELEITPQKVQQAVWDFKLPEAGTVVHFRHLTVGDETKLQETVQRFKSAMISAAMWLQIVDVGGKPISNPRDLRFWSTVDRAELRKAMDNTEGGVDLTVHVECPNCKTAFKDRVALDVHFFTTSASGSQQQEISEETSC